MTVAVLAGQGLAAIVAPAAFAAGVQPAAWSTTVTIAPAAVTTVAGTGASGTLDGPGASATFLAPNGMTIAGGKGYTFDASSIRSVDLATGVVATVVGNGSNTCTDSSDPTLVRVGGSGGTMATDGVYLYFEDMCASPAATLRRMDLTTRATSTVLAHSNSPYQRSITIGPDGSLYENDGGGGINRVDTATGATTAVAVLPGNAGLTNIIVTGLAADSTNLWAIGRGGCSGSGGNCTGIFKVDLTAGTATVLPGSVAQSVTANLQVAGYGPIVSAGSYLYANGTPGNVLRFRKSDGAWTSIAGSTAGGTVDGTGTQAAISTVSGIDTDGTNLWIADWNERRIRKLAPGTPLAAVQPGAWSTDLALNPVTVAVQAGSGTSAQADGTGTAASFTYPTSSVVVGANEYVLDSGRIRKIDLTTSAVTTIAGTGTIGCDDRTNPLVATVGNTAAAMVADNTYLYWIDTCTGSGQAVRRMSLSTGAISTLLTRGAFQGPTALTIGPDGVLYQDAPGGSGIERVDTVNNTTTALATIPVPPTGTFTVVKALAGDSTSLYAVAASQCSDNTGVVCSGLFKIDPSTGVVTTVSAITTSYRALRPTAPILSAGTALYTGVSSQPVSGDGVGGLALWAKSSGTATVLRTNEGGPVASGLAGAGPSSVEGLDVRGSAVYVTSANSHRVYRLGQAPKVGPVGKELAGGANAAQITDCSRCHGRPIDLNTGDQFESATDLSIPGRSVPLAFTRTYDTRLAGTAGRLGYGWSDSYDWLLSVDTSGTGTQGRVTVRQDNGSETTFYPDGAGGYTAPSKVLAALVKNGDGTWTYTLRRTVKYKFNSAGKPTTVTDLNNYVTTLTYDGSNRLTTVTDPAGRTFTFTYDTVVTTRIKTVADQVPRTVTYGYDAAGNLSNVTDADGRPWVLGYDAAHRLTTVKDPRLNTTTTEYDPGTGRAVKQTDRRGKITLFGYTAPAVDGTYTTTVTRPRGNIDVYTYLDGRAISETHGFGTTDATTLAFTYDPVTNGVTSVQDGLGSVSQATYDAFGNRLTAKDALNRQTTWTYNAFNEPLTETDPLGVMTTNTYDANGNVKTTSRPLVGSSPLQTATITYTYADVAHPGDVTSVTNPIGKITTFTYDANGYQNSVTDPTARKTTATYNVAGWQLTGVSPAGNVTGGTPAAWRTTYSNFTGFGQPKTVTDPLTHATTFGYDVDQNLTDITDAEARHTHTDYDAENHPTLVTRHDGTTAATSYDDNGNMAAQTDGLTHVTGYGYDNLDRVKTVTDALFRVTSYGYDLAGNLTTVAQPATGGGTLTTTSGYDVAGQLKTVSHSDGLTPNLTYNYDADAQRTSMIDGTGTTSYIIDSLHRITQITNGAGKVITYGYDLAGRNTTIGYPNISAALPGGTVTNAYDDAGRMISVKDWANRTTTFGYDNDARLNLTTSQNTVTGTNAYDNADRLTSITYKKATTDLGKYTYTYSNADLLATAAPSLTAPGTAETYPYTARAQLKSKAGAASTAIWGYDAADRVTRLPAGTTFGYDNADQLTTMTPTTGSPTTYTYDPRGNRTTNKIGTATPTGYAYDQEHRLKTVTTPAGAVSTYTYNGDGLRATKTPAGGSLQTMVWDLAAGLPLLLNDGTAHYIYGPGGIPVEQIKLVTTTVTPTYLHPDQLGSTVLITTSTGTKADTYTYDPYGTVTAHTGTTNTNLQYNGQYADTESGFIYLRARYYDPATVQFLTVDPVAAVTRARYAYAAGSPLSITDPTGLINWGDVGKGLGIAGAVAGAAAVCVFGGCEAAAVVGGGALVVEAGVLAVDVGAMAVGAAAGYIAGTAAASAGQSSAAAVQWLNESTSGSGGECSNTPREFKQPRPGSGKERASDRPSWVRNDPEGRPFKGETGSDFAKRMMDKKYGSGNWKPGPRSEYNQIKKYGDRGFQ